MKCVNWRWSIFHTLKIEDAESTIDNSLIFCPGTPDYQIETNQEDIMEARDMQIGFILQSLSD